LPYSFKPLNVSQAQFLRKSNWSRRMAWISAAASMNGSRRGQCEVAKEDSWGAFLKFPLDLNFGPANEMTPEL